MQLSLKGKTFSPVLPYILITVKAIKFEKVSLSDREKTYDYFLAQ